jgi:hypothetical protein
LRAPPGPIPRTPPAPTLDLWWLGISGIKKGLLLLGAGPFFNNLNSNQ